MISATTTTKTISMSTISSTSSNRQAIQLSTSTSSCLVDVNDLLDLSLEHHIQNLSVNEHTKEKRIMADWPGMHTSPPPHHFMDIQPPITTWMTSTAMTRDIRRLSWVKIMSSRRRTPTAQFIVLSSRHLSRRTLSRADGWSVISMVHQLSPTSWRPASLPKAQRLKSTYRIWHICCTCSWRLSWHQELWH